MFRRIVKSLDSNKAGGFKTPSSAAERIGLRFPNLLELQGSMARKFHSDLSLQDTHPVSNMPTMDPRNHTLEQVDAYLPKLRNNVDDCFPKDPTMYKGKAELINSETYGSLNPNVSLIRLSSSFRTAPMVSPLIPSTSSYQKKPRSNIHTTGSAQLTMFYAGTVNVYDNIPADKAEIIMSLAGSSSCKEKNPFIFETQAGPSQLSASCALPSDDLLQKMNSANMFQVASDREPQELSSVLAPLKAMVPKALPIARKASLARFLRTRRERVRAGDPYPIEVYGEGNRPHGRFQRRLCTETVGSSFGLADDGSSSNDIENEEYSNDASEHESGC